MNKEMSPSKLFGNLPVLKIIYKIKVDDEDAKLPDFLGSAWRGLIGWSLKKLLCPFDRFNECGDCLIKAHCPYYLLFENKTAMPEIFDAPRGYVIYPMQGNRKGEFDINITLIGNCTKFATVITKSLFEGQKSGIGKDRIAYRIISAIEQTPEGHHAIGINQNDHIEPVGPFPLEEWIKSRQKINRIYLITPLRLKKKGIYQRELDWPFFLSGIARRSEALNYLFNEGDLFGKEKWKKISNYFENNSTAAVSVKWVDIQRFSNRQKQKVPMGGLVGDANEKSGDPVICEWLATASILHVGKGASMGWGRIETTYENIHDR